MFCSFEHEFMVVQMDFNGESVEEITKMAKESSKTTIGVEYTSLLANFFLEGFKRSYFRV